MNTDYKDIIVTTKKGKAFIYPYSEYNWRFIDDKVIIKTKVDDRVILVLAREELESVEVR